MYPRNAATPLTVIVGVVVQISDGAVQTTGASVRVKTGTGAWDAGAGTLACDTTSGVWTYLPTQGETDSDHFMVAVYKASCLPAGVTVITTASATAGYAGTDQGKIANATSTVNLSGTTIKTATDVETDTADIQARIPASLVGGRMDASVGAMATNTLTAAAAAADLIAEIQIAITGGAYDLDTDANGRVRIVDGTGAGELDSSSGLVSVYDFSAAAKALLQVEAEDAIIAWGLDHLVGASVAGTDVVDDSIVAKLVSKNATADWDTFVNTTDSLEANRDNTGTAGAGLTAADDATLSAISALNNITAASVWAVGTRTLTAMGFTLADTDFGTDWLTSTGLAASAVQEIRNAVTGGAYSLSTDASGMVRVVDGTGAGEINTSSGSVSVFDFTTAAKALIQTEAEDALSIYDLPLIKSTVESTAVLVGALTAATIAVVTGTVAASPSPNASSFGSDLTSDTNWWNDALLTFTTGPASGLTRPITSFTNSGGVFTFDEAFGAAPVAGNTFSILKSHVHPVSQIQSGLATAASIAALNNITAASVWSVGTRTLTAGTNIALAKGVGVTGFTDLSAADVRTAVGLTSDNLETLLDALPTAAEIQIAITGGAYDLDTDANGRIRVVDGTGVGELDTSSGAVIAGSLGTTAKADVNTEVLDVMSVDTRAEPSQGTPGATISPFAKLDWLYKAWRNKKTQTSSLFNLFGDDASTVDQKSVVSDDGTTTTIGEMATGP